MVCPHVPSCVRPRAEWGEGMLMAGSHSKHAKPPTAEWQKAGEGEKKHSWQLYNVLELVIWDGRPLSSCLVSK